MSYIRRVWSNGDVIDANSLNNIENGVKTNNDAIKNINNIIEDIDDDIQNINDDIQSINDTIQDINDNMMDASDYYNKEEVDKKIDAIQIGDVTEGTEVIVVKDIFANNEMPKIYITSDELGSLSNKTQPAVKCECEIRINNEVIKCYVTGKVQGTSSATYPAKNFTFKFYSDKECTVKQKIDVGWGTQYKYCFKKNWVDTTHTRNVACARIACDMVDSRPSSEFKTNLQTAPRNGLIDGFPCKLYINGEFWGLYTWNIPKDDWMFNMDSKNPKHMVLCAEKNNDGNMSVTYSTQFRKLWDGNDGAEWSIEVGTLSNDLKDSFNNAIRFVMNSSDEEFRTNISNHFDLYSLLDYYLFSYFTCHYDGLGKNMLIGTYDGIHWGAMLYDMDSTFGANWQGSGFIETNKPCPSGYQENNSLLWQRIERCFVNELKERYEELRKGALSLGNVISHVEEIYDLIPDRVFNDERSKWTSLPSQNTNTMTRFRNYMRDRAKYVDKCISELKTPVDCTGVSLTPKTLVFENANTQRLTCTLTPSNTTQTVKYTASPSDVVKVNNGIVTPLKRGECVITATCGNYSDTCNVVVSCDIDTGEMEGYKRYVFDGSENWGITGWQDYANQPLYGIFEINMNLLEGSNEIEFPVSTHDVPTFLCDKYEVKTHHAIEKQGPDEGICGITWEGNKMLGVSTLDFPKGDLEGFKRHLAEDNLVVYFKLR